MNTTMTLRDTTATADRRRLLWPHADLHLLVAAIALVNLPMLTGAGSAAAFSFFPSLAAQGEWWRIFTHAFAHVSLYHLLLDAGAFVLLYRSMRDLRIGVRLVLSASAAVGSLALASLSPDFAAQGLCGLSGAAHGLMAISGFLTAHSQDRLVRRAGWIMSAIVTGKAIFEACTGHAFFTDLHFGNIGQPNPLCHLGGVIGALAAWGALQAWARKNRTAIATSAGGSRGRLPSLCRKLFSAPSAPLR